MKKIVSVLIALCMVFALAGCEGGPKKVLVRETWHYEGEDAFVRTGYAYNEDGLAVEKHEYDRNGFLNGRTTMSYDENGNQISERRYKADGTGDLLSWDAEYDKDGKMLKKTTINSDGSVMTWQEYSYDDKGNNTEIATYIGENQLSNRVTITYDEKGNPLKETTESIAGEWTSCQYGYDEKGNQTSETHYNNDGETNWLSSWTAEYDEKGNRTSETHYNSGGEVDSIAEFDAEGLMVKENHYDSGNTDKVSYWVEYEYAELEKGVAVTLPPTKTTKETTTTTEKVTATTEAPTTTTEEVTTTTEIAATTEAADDSTVQRRKGITTDVLNVRRDPSTDHDRVGMLQKSETVMVVGEEGNFYKIEYKWTQGGESSDYAYVSKDYVKFVQFWD